jgi:inhibitor of KinA sporulation pathway (predicted exonuclease)
MSSEPIAQFFTTHKQIVIFDTEFTTWEGAMERKWSDPNEHREVVQIAAQLIDLNSETVVSTFECLVTPSVNPLLSDYFVALTGITQERIRMKGIPFADAYRAFDEWSNGLPLFCYARTLTESADRGVFEENIQLYGLDLPLDSDRYSTLTGLFQQAGVDTKEYSSGEIYRAFNLTLDGQVHNAMHDVTSLVAAVFSVKKLNNVQ